MASQLAKKQPSDNRRRKAMVNTPVPPEMTLIQEALDKDNVLLEYKSNTHNGYTVIYCGVSGGGQEEDKKYLEHPGLRARIQRSLYFIFNKKDGRLAKVTHVCPKFMGQEDEGKMGLSETGFAPKVMLSGFGESDLAAADGIDIYEKLNGKCAQLSGFMDPEYGPMMILASKTSPTMFPLSMLDAAASGTAAVAFPASGLLAKMVQALVRMWQKIPAEGRDAIVHACIDDNMTLLMEFRDGMHMVPLPHGELPNLVITMVLEVAQSLDTSSSRVCRNIDGMHFTDWLRKVCLVPAEHIVAFKRVDIATWNAQTVKEFGTTNFFAKPGETGLENGTEGYVLHYTITVVTGGVPETKAIAIVKGKNDEYIILRSVRENSKHPGLTPEKAVTAITKKMTGDHAYPAGHSDKEVHAVALLVECFTRWLLKYTAEKKTTPRAILSFGDLDTADPTADNPLGMGNVWRRFMEDSAKSPLGRGFRIQDCFEPEQIDSLIETLGRYNATTRAADNGEHNAATRAAGPATGLPTSVVDTQLAVAVKSHVQPFLLRAGRNSDKRMKGNITPLGVSCELTEYSGTNDRTIVIMRAVPGSGKTSCVKAAAEQLTKTLGPNSVTVASADDYWETRTFDPRLLGEAHKQCRMKAYTSESRFVIIDNTNCDIADSFLYVKFAKDSGFNVVFWSIDMLGGRADCATLAVRGLHLKDLTKVQQYWDRMHSTPIPATMNAYFGLDKLKNCRAAKCHGACIDLKIPDEIRKLVPMSKVDGHVTLGYKKLHSSFYHLEWSQIPVTFKKVYVCVDGPDAVACASVELPAEYMALCGAACQPHLHVTLFTNGKCEARESADLVSGALASTQVIDILADNIVVTGQISNF